MKKDIKINNSDKINRESLEFVLKNNIDNDKFDEWNRTRYKDERYDSRRNRYDIK